MSGCRWVADWVEPEPADLAPPTLAWQLWHASWWLSMVLDHSFGPSALTREGFRWEGPDRGLEPIVDLHHRWVQHLAELPEQRWEDDHLTRWPYADGRPFALVAGWVSMELTKNVAEMVRARGYAAAAGEADGVAGSAPRS